MRTYNNIHIVSIVKFGGNIYLVLKNKIAYEHHMNTISPGISTMAVPARQRLFFLEPHWIILGVSAGNIYSFRYQMQTIVDFEMVENDTKCKL